jgi:hypothetical protein
MSRLDHSTYLQHIRDESRLFRDVLADCDPAAPVPTCPEWRAADLLWHLGEVQWFWGTVVRERVTGDQAEALKPPRPGDRSPRGSGGPDHAAPGEPGGAMAHSGGP